jgi:RecB family exonuclease
MPTPKIQQITQWSYSRLSDYRKCPAFAKFKHIDKLKEPGNAAMARGNVIHKLAEAYSKATKRTPTPKELENFKQEFLALQKCDLSTEQQIAFTFNWEKTGWFDPDCWVRVVMDYFYLAEPVLHVGDYKTGKEYPDHEEQAELYGIAGLSLYPQIEEVQFKYLYLDQGTEREFVFKRAQLPELKRGWLNKTRAMLNDKTFAPRPNSSCKWCHFRRDNNGPCAF